MTADQLSARLRDAPRFRAVGVVHAEQLSSATSWQSQRGAELRAQPGDWLVSDDSGGSWTVGDEIFRRTYQEQPDGRFAKIATVRAIRVAEPVEVPTLEGPARAERGDWVLRGADGELWPVTDEHFRASYRPEPGA